MYFFYSLLLGAAMGLSLPYWLYQMFRHGKYRLGFWERFGKVPQRLQVVDSPVIWVHAVSVGEVLAISGLVEGIQREFPRHRVVVSTTTDTGQTLARRRFGADSVLYFPVDFAFAIRPYLRVLRPQLVVLTETEFWPNFLRSAHDSGAKIAVVNARISDRSRPNYKRFSRLLKQILLKVDLFLAQTEEDRARLVEIGAPGNRVRVTGNIKFDLPIPVPPPIVERLRRSLREGGGGPVLVCGSTVDDEEPLLLKAFENVLVRHLHAVMVLVPRHPERFDAVATLVRQMGIHLCRRSLWNDEPLSGAVLLVDTIGELAALYALADIVFVGGSLVPRGGHNILEPAQHGVAVVVGNHTENFRDIVGLFQSRDAVRVAGPAELPLVFMELLANNDERLALGRRALETVRSQTGATERSLQALTALLSEKSANSRSVTAPGKYAQKE